LNKESIKLFMLELNNKQLFFFQDGYEINSFS